MKTVKNFLVDFTFSLLISLPCFFLCDMIEKKEVVDWFDLQLGLGGVAFLLLVAYLLFARHNKESKGAKILSTMTIMAIVATLIYGAFMLLEWLFPDNADSSFTGNWEQWFPVSISLSVFLFMQNKRTTQSYENDNDLVVAVECQDKTDAERICTILDENGIKAIAVEKESPMYINSVNDAPVQVQVMGKELKRTKEALTHNE
jgi:hypothetical protein